MTKESKSSCVFAGRSLLRSLKSRANEDCARKDGAKKLVPQTRKRIRPDLMRVKDRFTVVLFCTLFWPVIQPSAPRAGSDGSVRDGKPSFNSRLFPPGYFTWQPANPGVS